MKIILCIVIALCSLQSNGPTFYVERVEVLSKDDPTYIHWLGNKIVPPDKPVDEHDVQCLASEITASGVFKDVKTSFASTASDDRRLLVSASSPEQIESFVISGIRLDRLPKADENAFQEALGRRGIKPGLPFLQFSYRELYEKTVEALYEIYPDRSLKDAKEEPWMTIRPDGPKRVELIVSPDYRGCNGTTGSIAGEAVRFQ